MPDSTEVSTRACFREIRYAQCWEDASILLEALQPAPGKRYLSIASAGDNTLALLLGKPKQVVAVDLSPAQLASLEIRVRAMQVLDHAAFLKLLGARPATGQARHTLYQQVRPSLSKGVAEFWDARSEAITKGVAYAGRFERYFEKFGKYILPLIHRRRTIEGLFEKRSREERAVFYDEAWNTWRWRVLCRLFFSRTVMGRLGRDPAFFKYVEDSLANHLMERVRHALVALDPSINPYLSTILNGRPGASLPVAWRADNYERIRSQLDCLEWHQTSVEEFLTDSPDLRFDGFNLSDIFEYMSVDNTEALLETLVTAGQPGARLAYWNMLVPRSRPVSMAEILRPLEALSEQLHRQDQAFFYRRFVVEEVVG